MLRLSDNPPMAFSDSVSLDDSNLHWTAVYCKPRQEKALAWDLQRRQITYFLPMVMRETFSGGRKRRNMYPVFESYLFLAAGNDERLAVLKTNRILQLIEISEVDQPSFRHEICGLELTLRRSPEGFDFYPGIAKGKRVRIIGGPMLGVEGVIIKIGNHARLWVGVTMMGAGVTVEIHSDLVETLDARG